MAKRSLFVRMLGTYEEVEELERILSGMVANEFRLLVVNCSGVTELTEVDWQLPHVCAVEMPLPMYGITRVIRTGVLFLKG